MVVSQSTWPDRALFAQFVQAPSRHFRDEELATSVFARTRLGMPQAWSGGRAVVFKAVTQSGRTLAVRFLLAEDQGHRQRYDALGAHMAQSRVPCLVPTQWVDGGVVFDSRPLPLIKMDWVEGAPLDEHVDGLLGEAGHQAALRNLAEQWRDHSRELRAAGIAHGDIHAQNVVMCPDGRDHRPAIRLVDYDCVWLPSITGAPPNEVGHPNFRHPARITGNWGPAVDAFPNLVVYLSLRAVAADPSLWQRFHRVDGALLFEGTDLNLSRDRGLWAALHSSPDDMVQAMTLLLQQWLVDHPERHGSLDDALDLVEGSSRRAGSDDGETERIRSEPLNTWAPSSRGHVARDPGHNAQWTSSATPTAAASGQRQAWAPQTLQPVPAGATQMAGARSGAPQPRSNPQAPAGSNSAVAVIIVIVAIASIMVALGMAMAGLGS
jgi:hypothetical protein